MEWFYKGIVAAVGQMVLFVAFIMMAAGALWSCDYLGIPQGYGVLSFYSFLILSINLFFAWKTREVEMEKVRNVD